MYIDVLLFNLCKNYFNFNFILPRENGDYNALTKGDNNEVNDRGLYERGQFWLNKKNIFGRIKGFLPKVGILTIIMNDYPYLKYGILGVMTIMVLTSKDPNDN